MAKLPEVNSAYSLDPEEVQVWLLWHRTIASGTDELARRLTADEQIRAAKFLNDRAKFEFCLTRSVLRRLLSRYGLGRSLDIALDYGEHGKPELASTDGDRPSIRFNVAHTRELSAFAFSTDIDVGIDVEFQREVRDADRIVSGKFAFEERAIYKAANAAQREQLFFRGWTRKEAFIKATGEGLCRSLESFAVTIDDDNDVSFLRVDNDDATHWRLFNIPLGKQHAGAVAIRNSAARVVTREWVE